MRPAGGKLSLELRHECGEAINGFGWELGEPTEGCSLQGCRKHSTQHCIVRGIKTHMGSIRIHMVVWVGGSIIPSLLKPFHLSDNRASMKMLVKGCR